MKATGQILCYRQWGGDEVYSRHMEMAHKWSEDCHCETSTRSEWIGGAVARVSGQILTHARLDSSPGLRRISKDVYQIGGFRVRLIDMEITSGMMSDTWLVMQDGFAAQCVKAYRGIAKRLLEVSVRAEVYARSFGTPVIGGEYLHFTGGLAKILL